MIDKESELAIADTTERLSNPFTFFFFVMRMTFQMWKFYFGVGREEILHDLEFKRREGAKHHGANIWSKSQLKYHMEEEFLDILGWGDMYEQKNKSV